ncbi:MAG: hypothetical protein H7239_10390 [Flavobacterium sp.]|nr:hypothetical protein [Flavobacterium sp.]
MPVTRSFIDEIKIQNFKFFHKFEKSIKLDGKHLLLYGENGAGKSSIYWGLYTLLECANKEDEEQIKKYFDPKNEESLNNVHIKPATADWVDPYIEVTIKDGSNPYFVSLNDNLINKNKEAQESNYSSDFITYRNLLSLYNFSHADDIDLFPYFVYAVLPYIKLTPVTYWNKKKDGSIEQLTTDSANTILRFVNKGPQKNKKNRQGKFRFPINKEQEFSDYRSIVVGFKKGLTDLITYINTEGNPILKEDLGYDLTFKLEFEEIPVLKKGKKTKNPFILTQQNFEAPKYKIKFDITEYEGIPNAVKRAQSFLNEAKLTAVGLAIRLAVLKKALSNDAKLKLLVLDDLLISLDMSNREKIIDLLLYKYQNEYQILLFTHERSLYEITKSKIKNAGFNNFWVYKEMYVDDTTLPSKPIILISKERLLKAEEYIAKHDYPAAGIYLRTACEELLDNLYPDFCKFKVKKEDGNEETIPINLNDKILKLKEFCLKENIDYEPFKDLKIYKDNFLNAVAHNDINSPLYKTELVSIHKVLKQLKRIKRSRSIVKNGKDLLFDLVNNENGESLHIGVKLKDNLTIIEQEGLLPRLSYYNQCEILKVVKNGVEDKTRFNVNSLIEFYNLKCIELNIKNDHDLFQLFKYRGNPIEVKYQELLKM